MKEEWRSGWLKYVPRYSSSLKKKELSLTLNLTICFSPAFIFRATSSSVRCRHRLSYDALEPALASFSRVSVSRSGEQKHR